MGWRYLVLVRQSASRKASGRRFRLKPSPAFVRNRVLHDGAEALFQTTILWSQPLVVRVHGGGSRGTWADGRLVHAYVAAPPPAHSATHGPRPDGHRPIRLTVRRPADR